MKELVIRLILRRNGEAYPFWMGKVFDCQKVDLLKEHSITFIILRLWSVVLLGLYFC